MTLAYKYYRDEIKRHREAHSLKYNLSECIEASHHLFARAGRARIDIRTNLDAKPRTGLANPEWSWFVPPRGLGVHRQRAYISYGYNCMSALTVAHEVAHYFQFEDEERRYREWIQYPAAKRQAPRFVYQKDHGPGHRKWVDRCIVWLRAGWYMGAIREVA